MNGTPGSAIALWPLPLAGGLMPAIAALLALWLSFALGIIPQCNPFLDGCVSISRAARHDLPNHVFRAIVLPAAALQALTWLLCAAWLRRLGAETRGALHALPWLGVLAGVFLVLYGTFLGTEGQAYRWMRRYGVIFYFGFTYLCMVIMSGALRRLVQAGKLAPPARLDRWLIALCVATLAIGLVQVFTPPFLNSEDLKNRLENILEWYAALCFTLYFLVLAWLWRHARLGVRLGAGDA
jgi:NADH:ubiquinone oxidoreductase subunit 6 (subunit J)